MSAIRSIIFALLSCTALYADNLLHPGVPKLDRPTLTALGIQLPLTGDDNFNASVSVQYRVTGTQTWQNAMPLFRVHPETVAVYVVAPQFGGSIFDLRPGTSYDIQLHAVDPDGLDQTFTLTGTTRPVPADPVNPRIVNVTDSVSLNSALFTALPGDVITLANGFYPGQFQIQHAGTPTNPIVIRGASEDGVILDGGNCPACNVFEVYGAGYVHVERLTLQNATRGIRFQGAGSIGNVLRRVHIKNTQLGVGGQPNQLDLYIADNILEGRLVWPHVNSDDNGVSANDDGIAVIGSGHVVSHNRISGFGDAMKTSQDGARANDFYGNDILYTYDNGIELDGSEGNTRCFRNRFMNCFSPLSVQPIHGGPSYILRNVVVNIVAEQMKFHPLGTTPFQEPSGVLVYNNTFVAPPHPSLWLQTPGTSHYFEIENNLFLAPAANGGLTADWEGPIDHGVFDYNGYFPDGMFRFNDPTRGGYFLQFSFAGLQGLGMEPHGLLANGAIFASGLTAPSTYTILMPPADATLAAGSIVLDRGRVLPNITDNYQGTGPDLGALERGCPNPTYGPRPEGIDETNESVGCAAPGVTSVTVSPTPVTLGRSATQQFTATTVPAGGMVTWTVSPARGTVSGMGFYTAPADALLGEQVTVTAVSTVNGAISGSAVVTFTAPVVTTLTPASVTLAGSQTQQFTATVTGALNTSVTWIQSPAIGTVTAGGLFTAPAAIGTAQTTTLTAASVADPTKTASAAITVSASPVTSVSVSPAAVTLGRSLTQQFTATTIPAGSPVTWSISPARGIITAGGLYTSPADALLGEQITVTAVSTLNSAVSGTATVNLTAPLSLSLSPPNATLSGSATQQYTATVTGAVNTGVTWVLTAPIGSITAGGLYTAPPATAVDQTLKIKAVSVADPTRSVSTNVTVSGNPITSVSVSPAAVSVRRGFTQQFTATTAPTGRAVTWSISPARGTISAAGLYTAPADALLGEQVTVTAVSTEDPAISGAAIVNLTMTVATTLTPASVTLAGSASQQFIATVTGAVNGNVTWSLTPVIGTITAGGLYTAPSAAAGAQTTTLTAVSVADPTKSASATITINANPIVSVSVSPSAVTLGRSAAQQFTAATIPAASPVMWTISPARGTITPAGLYTAPVDALFGEQVTVSAVSAINNAIFGSASVSLTAPIGMSLSPPNVTLDGLTSQQYTATVTGAVNTNVTWVLTPAIGSITPGGLFTAPPATSVDQTLKIKAVSVANPTRSISVNVTVNAAP